MTRNNASRKKDKDVFTEALSLKATCHFFRVSPLHINGETRYPNKEMDAIQSVLNTLSPNQREDFLGAITRRYLHDARGEISEPQIESPELLKVKRRALAHYRLLIDG